MIKIGSYDFAGKRRQFRHGAAAMEFAIVAPIFFLFLMGIVDVSRMIMTQTVLINASREACRVAIIQGSTEEEIEETAVQFAEAGMVEGITVDVAIEEGSSGGSDFVTVTLSVPFSEVSWSGMVFSLGDQELMAATTMRRELY
jgi:Flp pilus assembly protein TadG